MPIGAAADPDERLLQGQGELMDAVRGNTNCGARARIWPPAYGARSFSDEALGPAFEGAETYQPMLATSALARDAL